MLSSLSISAELPPPAAQYEAMRREAHKLSKKHQEEVGDPARPRPTSPDLA